MTERLKKDRIKRVTSSTVALERNKRVKDERKDKRSSAPQKWLFGEHLKSIVKNQVKSYLPKAKETTLILFF